MGEQIVLSCPADQEGSVLPSRPCHGDNILLDIFAGWISFFKFFCFFNLWKICANIQLALLHQVKNTNLIFGSLLADLDLDVPTSHQWEFNPGVSWSRPLTQKNTWFRKTKKSKFGHIGQVNLESTSLCAPRRGTSQRGRGNIHGGGG